MIFFSVDYKEYFSKEAIKNRIKEAGTELASAAIESVAEKFLEQLGLPAVCIDCRVQIGPSPGIAGSHRPIVEQNLIILSQIMKTKAYIFCKTYGRYQ